MSINLKGGEDSDAIVIDFGSSTFKVGFGGEEAPSSLIPSYVGVVGEKEGKKLDMMDTSKDYQVDHRAKITYYAGEQNLNFPRKGICLQSPLTCGVITNFDHIERILNHTYKDVLSVNPTEQPLLLTEVPYNSQEARIKAAELAFEVYKHPALFIAKRPVLSAFGSGRQTSLVIQSGAKVTCVSPVWEGYVLNKGVVRNNNGGDDLVQEMLKFYTIRGKRLVCDFMVDKVKDRVKLRDHSQWDRTYVQWGITGLLNDIKSDIFSVSPFALPKINISSLSVGVDDDVNKYLLPDGSTLKIGKEKEYLCEIFFEPSNLIKTNLNQQQTRIEQKLIKDSKGLINTKCIHKMALESINSLEHDGRRFMFTNMILSGGNTCTKGFKNRLLKEMISKTPMSIRTSNPFLYTLNERDRKHSAWIGGSILSCLTSFQTCWMSIENYKEEGALAVAKYFP